jgi:hypothetical protein
MNDDYQVKILKTTSEIEKFRDAWKNWASAPYSDIDFFLTSIKVRKDKVLPYVILLLVSGTPKAMLIGCIDESVLPIKVSHLTLFSARLRTLSIVPGGLIGDQSCETGKIFASEIIKLLSTGQVEAVRMPQIRLESDFFKSLQKATPFICRDHALEHRRHWRLKMPNDVAGIYVGFSAQHRKKLRWQNKNIEKKFPTELRIRCFRRVDELEQMIKDVEAIAAKTYQRALGASFVDNESNRMRVSLESERDWLRMYVLYGASQPIAYWWGTLYQGTFYSEAMGFDPEYKRYSPGTYLLTKTVEEMHRSGVKCLDFGAGDFHYKQQFGNVSWDETMVFNVFAPSLRPIALNIANSLVGKFRFFGRPIVKKVREIANLPKRFSVCVN